MRINREQMRAMVAGSETLQHVAIKKLVREEHAYVVDGLPEDLLDEMIKRGVTTARGYGLTAPDALATFVLLMFEFGPEFHRHPAIRPILTDTATAPEARLTAVIERTSSEVWEQIQSVLHRQTWFPELGQPEGE